MKFSENIENLTRLNIDFIGFILYPKSKRYIEEIPFNIPSNFLKVGVFVDEKIENLISISKINKLDYVQLHGNEDAKYCRILKENSIRIIRAFSIDENFDFAKTNEFAGLAEYFIFDTKGKNPGGNGIKFDWEILSAYKAQTPFLLSGGIKPDDFVAIKNFKHQKFAGIDINSGFETEPGRKDIELIQEFLIKLK